MSEILEKIKTYFQYKKRKRVSPPITLIILGSLFLLIPLFNYISIAYYNEIPFFNPKLVFKTLKKFEQILLLSSLVVGFGLLSVKRWGWYSFLVYALVMIIYNLIVIIKNPVIYNIGAFVQTIIVFVAIIYFLRKDISAPYFKMYPRGWRGEKRNPIQIQVKINNFLTKTKDLSQAGLYAEYTKFDLVPNQKVQVEFTYKDNHFILESGIVRIDDDGIGIAFRNLSKENEAILEKLSH